MVQPRINSKCGDPVTKCRVVMDSAKDEAIFLHLEKRMVKCCLNNLELHDYDVRDGVSVFCPKTINRNLYALYYK